MCEEASHTVKLAGVYRLCGGIIFFAGYNREGEVPKHVSEKDLFN